MSSGSGKFDPDQPTLPPGTGKEMASTNAGEPTLSPGTRKEFAPTMGADTQGTSARTSRELPVLEDYELIEELGRGGMGVVYRARNKKLDRVVALKMILGGRIASKEDVRRFQLEAETAAKLDHPGIVPIYEVGQSNEHHFFAMKLIEGHALSDRLEDYQSDPRKSAELMIKISRAVHHAHERGVLHRDLKPANVLIDTAGNPAVTDLGLAKQLDDDSGLTKTGLVMGSPGFMSPEQAKGLSDVTTAVDVYSLGAVLYWLIAGRPPHVGETQFETIMKTIEKEAESIRVHRPDADRDLNLICLKALEKSSDDRYASANDFADDLQAWLDGDALSVKPPTAFDHARIWVRKNFRTVAIALCIGVVSGFIVGGIIFTLLAVQIINDTSSINSQLGEETVNWVTQHFGWLRATPKFLLGMLPPCMIWSNVLLGILAIGLIKPKSREVGLVAATAAALLAGIVSYNISLGWFPIAENSITLGRQDIELISSAMWLDKPAERELARRAIIQRYPGLPDVEMNQRSDLLVRKIIHDQRLGIPKGMWIGIGTTLCISVLPLFFAIAFSSFIWEKGRRGFSYFGSSIELAIYCGLFFLLTSKLVTTAVGLRPGMLWQVVSMLGIAASLFFAVKDWKWPWRILAFVLATVCLFGNFYESSRIQAAWSILDDTENDTELRESLYLLKEKTHQGKRAFDRFLLGIYAAYLNDDELYSRQCKALLSDFENVFDPEIAERMVKLCCLKPNSNSLTKDQMDLVYELGETVSGYDSSAKAMWLYLSRGFTELRRDNPERVFEWTQKCRDKIEDPTKPSSSVPLHTALIIDALAHQQLGNHDKSSKLIARVDKCLEIFASEIPTDVNDADFVVLKILKSEWDVAQGK